MSVRTPKFTKALTVQKSSVDHKPTYHDVVIETRPISPLKSGEVLVKIAAAAFNHRELWIRKGQYPQIVFGSVLGADGAGIVIASGDANDSLINKRVFLTPMRGWEIHPLAPESNFGIVGGGALPPIGTFAEYVTVERNQVILSPNHLDDVQMAAWPLAALTAWRAAVVNAKVQAGQNILITGIGGGVALTAMQICIGKGASVYVTSGTQEKIQRAVALGAKGGANYKDEDWPAQIKSLLPKGTFLDAVIDSGGGDIMGRTNKHLKAGGRVVCYGMTANPKITMTMREVLQNQQLIGSTMGSHQDLINATRFMEENEIEPIVSNILDGLECADEGFELIKRGEQFGKIVIKMRDTQSRSKL